MKTKPNSIEQEAICEIIETTMIMLQYHPDLSSFDMGDWEISITGNRMELQAVMDMELSIGDEEDE